MKPRTKVVKAVRAWAITSDSKIVISKLKLTKNIARRFVAQNQVWSLGKLDYAEVEIRPISKKGVRGK